MNKLYLALLCVIVGVGFVLAGCSSTYDNFEMDITSGNEITIFLEDNSTLELDDASATLNVNEGTAEIKVSIKGGSEKVSKEVIVSSSDVAKLRVQSNKVDEQGNSTIIVRAFQAGEVTLFVRSAEGGLSQNIAVHIIKKTSAISVDDGYKFAVMSNGTPYKIDETKFIQYPSDSTRAGFIYSLYNDIAGVSISEDGTIIATSKPSENIILQIKPKYAVSDSVATIIEIPVYNGISSSDLILNEFSRAYAGQIESNSIEIIKNKAEASQKIIYFAVSPDSQNQYVADELDNLQIKATLSDTTLATFDNSKATNNAFCLIGVNNGTTELNIQIFYKDFENVVVFNKTYNLVVRDVATTISFGSSVISDTLNVYNLPEAKNIGTEFIVNIYPDTASNRKYIIQFAEEYQEYISNFVFTNSAGKVFDIESTEFSSGQKIYVYHVDFNLDIVDHIDINIVSADSDAMLSKTLSFNLLLNIEKIECESQFILIYDRAYTSNPYIIDYVINPVGAKKSSISIVASNTSVISIGFLDDEQGHFITPLAIGNSKIFFYANNRLIKTATVEVVTEFKNILVNIAAPSQNSSVSSRYQMPIYSGSTQIGESTSNAIIKIGKYVKLETTSYPADSKLDRLEYKVIEAKDNNGNTIDASSVSIENGSVRSSKTISLFYVQVLAYGYIINDETGNVEVSQIPVATHTIAFTVILPIRDISLNAETVELYDIETVGYAELSRAQFELKLTINPTNATVDTSNISWTIDKVGYDNIISVQENNTALITGRLPANAGSQETVTIRATIAEYDVVLSRECSFIIKKAKQVDNIILKDYDYNEGVYLKHSGVDETQFVADTYQINATAMPLNATNSNLDYFAFDITKNENAGDDWFNIGAYTKQESTRIAVDKNGMVRTLPNAPSGGYSIVYVVARDNVTKEGIFNENEIKKYAILLFKVADGVEVPFEIHNYSDFIQMSEALDKNYVLNSSIDLSGISDIVPIGTEDAPFTGSLSGRYYKLDGSYINYSILNYHINLNQTTINDIATQQQSFGLFGYTSEDAVISNLTLTISNSIVNAIIGENFIFGALVGVNSGLIYNCHIIVKGNVVFNIAKLTSSDAQIGIAMLAGINFGVINDEGGEVNSSVVASNNATISVNTLDLNIDFGIEIGQVEYGAVGGLVGLNKGKIYGIFNYGGDLLDASSMSYEIEFNVDYNASQVSSMANIIVSIDKEIYVGGAVGYNNNYVQGLSFAGSVAGVKNVGGVIGYNNSVASHLLSYGFISSSSQVLAQSIGGVIGQNGESGVVSLSMFENYEDATHITISSQTAQNIGSLIGSNIGAVSYSYSYSYSIHKESFTHYDLVVSSEEISNVGGLIGLNAGTISNSFSNVAISSSNANNFVASNMGTISDCYYMGFVGEQPNSVTQTKVGTYNASNWTNSIQGRNYGYPMLKLDDNTVLLTEPPIELTATVLDYASTLKANRFYKITNSRVLLLLNQSSENSDSVYNLKDIISVHIVPLSERTRSLNAEVYSGNSVSISGQYLTALSQGASIIRIYSPIDSTIYADIEVYVVHGITSIDISNVSNQSLELAKDTSFELKLVNLNQTTVGQEVAIEYQSLVDGGYMYYCVAPDFVSFDYQLGENPMYVSINNTQTINALKSTYTNALSNNTLQIKIYPYAMIEFEGVSSRFVFSDIEYILNVSIYEGISNIALDKTNEQIVPSVLGSNTVVINTDLETDFISNVEVFDEQGNILGSYNVEFDGYVYSITSQNISEQNKVDFNIISTYYIDETLTRYINLTFTPHKNIGDFETTTIYTYKFYSVSQNGTTFVKQFKLTIQPQPIDSITIKHFTDGADFDSTLTGAGETATDLIIAGQYGLLTIDLYPNYSVYSNLILSVEGIDSDNVAFQQFYYNPITKNFIERVKYSSIVDNGITLIRVSNKNGNNVEFNGKIYVKTLLSSIVPEGQQVVFKVSAYDDNDELAYSNSITLTSESVPYVDIKLTDNTKDSFVPANNDFYMNIAYEYGSTFVALNFYTMEGNEQINISNITTRNVGERSVVDGKYVQKVRVLASDSFVQGKTYYVEAIVTKPNGIETKSARAQAEFTIVNFIINNVDVQYEDKGTMISIANGKLSEPLNKDGWKLSVVLDAIGDLEAIKAFENYLNARNPSTTINDIYPLWYYVNSSTARDSAIMPNVDYSNFTLNFVQSPIGTTSGGYTLIGRTIANVDTLKAMFDYYYNENGEATAQVLDYPTTQFSFSLNFSLSSSFDHPLPIYTEADLINMEDGIDYILLKDIELSESFTPISTAISSLDGNGYSITVKSFNTSFSTSNQIQIGLFSQVDSSTILKNLKIVLDTNNKSLDLINYSNISFGYIAGINYGTITNSCVVSLQKVKTIISTALTSQESIITAHIGGFVGVNNGQITNSRVENIEINSGGVIGGFVSENHGAISSSYSKAVKLTSSIGQTAGFVAINGEGAKILASFVKGEWTNPSASIRADVLAIESESSVGGFVYENAGTISDCYSNITIRSQSRSGGFIFKNNASGIISNSISYSNITQNNIAHMPFIATGDNEIFQNAGKFENVYFYMTDSDVFVLSDRSGKGSGAQKLGETELSNQDYLPSFAFDDYDKANAEEDTEYNGVWVMPSSYYEYFKIGTNDFYFHIPELVDANIISACRRELYSTDIVNGVPVYTYIYTNDSTYSYLGTLTNPYLISSVDDFINAFVVKSNNELQTISSVHARLIRDISFEDYREKLDTSRVKFSGILNGNGFTMHSISLVASLDYDEQSFGLFNSLNCLTNSFGTVINRGVIKNINVNFIEVKASQVPIVGGLVGVSDGGLLANINVSGDNVAVKGSNIVGGVAGLVKGSSHLFNVHSQLSANAGYRNSSNTYKSIVYYDDAPYINEEGEYIVQADTRSLTNSIAYVSYAGAVAGIFDVEIRDTYQDCMRISAGYDISASGNIKVVGSTAGGVFGMVGLSTFVKNARFIVEQGQFLNGENIVGGLIGELRGKIEQCYINHQDIIQNSIDNLSYGVAYEKANTTLFKDNAKTIASGGLVGFNFGGTILNSYSKVDVRNKYSNSAGGIVGVSLAGDIRAVFSSGSIIGSAHVGGIIGRLLSTIITDVEYNDFYNLNYLPLEMNSVSSDVKLSIIDFDNTLDKNSISLSYVVAGNNWLNGDITKNKSINFGGIIGYMPIELASSYIITTHPTDETKEENLINFYVCSVDGNNSQFVNGAIGNIYKYIASPIAYRSLTYANKSIYFGNWFRFTWDLSTSSKFPIINPKTIPSKIEIYNYYELMQMVWKLDADYILCSDIDLSGISSWLPIGTEQAPFCGTFNSKVKYTTTRSGVAYNEYYTIEGLTIKSSYLENYGLFGVTGYKTTIENERTIFTPCVIKNINITVNSINSTAYSSNQVRVGALVGYAKGVTIENCTVSNYAPPNGGSNGRRIGIISNSNFVGGLVGEMTDLPVEMQNISNAYVAEEFEGQTIYSKVSERTFLSSILYCVSTVDIYLTTQSEQNEIPSDTTSYVGGLVGFIKNGTSILESWSSQKIEFISTNSTQYYNSNFIIGGLIGSHDALNPVSIQKCFSNSKIIHEKINVSTYAYLIIGGFIGQSHANLKINYCFSSDEIQTAQSNSTVNDYVKIGGFVGEILSTSTLDNFNFNYSITSFKNFVETKYIGGFVGAGSYGELANDSSINYYDELLALLPDDTSFSETTTNLRENVLNNDNEGVWVADTLSFYPLIKSSKSVNGKTVVLGLDKLTRDNNEHNTHNAFDDMRKGSKVNPILIETLEDFEQMIANQNQSATTPDDRDYNYYLQTQNLNLDESEILSQGKTIIVDFYGFYNGDGLSIMNYKLINIENIYNVGLFSSLKNNSVISGVNLSNLYIDVQSSQYISNDEENDSIDDKTLNIGGLVGYAEDGVIYASTVNGSISAVPYSIKDTEEIFTQNINIGGVCGNANKTQIFYCANYAQIATFDYRMYYGLTISASEQLKPETLNMGAIVGKYVGSSEKRYKIQNIYSLGELDYTDGSSTNVGNLLGYADNVKLQNYYSVTNVLNAQNTLSTNTLVNIGGSGNYMSVDATNTNITDEINSNSDFAYNYGYATFDIIKNSAIKSIVEIIDDGNGETYSCVKAINASQLQYLLSHKNSQNEYYNISLDRNIYADDTIFDQVSYNGYINGNFNAIFNLSSPLLKSFDGIMKNIKLTNSYFNSSPLMISVGDHAVFSEVSATSISLTSSGSQYGSHSYSLFSDYNTYSLDSDSDNWLDLGDGNGNVLRAFTEYWDSTDLRCVYLDSAIISEDINGQPQNVDYIALNDKYQLAKLLELSYIDSEMLIGNHIKFNYSVNYDMAGKIWSGFGKNGAMSSKLIGERNVEIKNLYTEGYRNVGFISYSSETQIDGISFNSAKLVVRKTNEVDEEPANFGVLIGQGSDMIVSNIEVKGNISIDMPNAINVGGVFGHITGELNNISVSSTSQIIGLDAVGGIAGNFIHNTENQKTGDFNNTMNVMGHNYIGGFFGIFEENNAYYLLGTLQDKTKRLSDDGASSNNGTIIGNNFVGGIAGMSQGKMSLFLNNGEVKSCGSYVGGIVGLNKGILKSSSNYGQVQNTSLAYENATSSLDTLTQSLLIDLTEINSNFTNTMLNGGYFYGGIVGVNENHIVQCMNFELASVSGVAFVGGIAGLNTKVITGKKIDELHSINSQGTINNASVYGLSFVGGIAGYNASEAKLDSVINDYGIANSQLSSQIYLGGIVGYNDGWLLDVTMIGEISGQILYLGGIAGYNASNGIIQSACVASATLSLTNEVDYVFNPKIYINGANITHYYMGGITSVNDGIIKMSALQDSSRLVRSADFRENVIIGGLSGVNNGDIQLSFTSADTALNFIYSSLEAIDTSATPTDDLTIILGGLVGQNNIQGTINSAYSMLAFNLVEQAGQNKKFNNIIVSGAMVGENSGAINDAYAIVGDTLGTALYGSTTSTISTAYYVKNVGGEYVVPTSDSANYNNYKQFLSNNFMLNDIMLVPLAGGGYEIITTVNFDIGGNLSVDRVNDAVKIEGIEFNIIPCGAWAGNDSTESKVSNNQSFALDGSGMFNDFGGYYTLYEEYKYNNFTADILTSRYLAEYSSASLDEYIFKSLSQCAIQFLSWTGRFMPIGYNASDISNYESASLLSSGFAGSGTSDDPFKIVSKADFATIQYYLERGQKSEGNYEDFTDIYFEITNDIYMDNEGIIIGTDTNHFNGFINGKNHRIYNFNNSFENLNNVGLFGVLGSNARIENIIFVNPIIAGNDNVGVLAGTNNGNIKNIIVTTTTVSGYQVSGYNNVGGIVGLNQEGGQINVCQSDIQVEGIENVGGICGENLNIIHASEYITNSELVEFGSLNKVLGQSNVGGIVGYNAGFVSECANSNEVGTIQGTSSINVGGIIGFQRIKNDNVSSLGIQNCINYGRIIGAKYIGGIIGYCDSGPLSYTISTGTVLNSAEYCGEIYGYWNSNSSKESYIIRKSSALGANSASTINSGVKMLSDNQMRDVARRMTNYKVGSKDSFDFEKVGSIWGLTLNNIQNGQYSGQLPLLTNLISSKLSNFSYNIFNGAGIEGAPYLIECQEQLDKFRELINSQEESNQNKYNFNQYYKIDTTVYDNEYKEGVHTTTFTYNTWQTLQDMDCAFDANGYSINIGTLQPTTRYRAQNNDFERDIKYCGLTAILHDYGKILNLNLIVGNMIVDGVQFAGCIAGAVKNPNDYIHTHSVVKTYSYILDNIGVTLTTPTGLPNYITDAALDNYIAKYVGDASERIQELYGDGTNSVDKLFNNLH